MIVDFSTTMCDMTDLDLLSAAVLGVVDQAVQPEFVGLWLQKLVAEKQRETV